MVKYFEKNNSKKHILLLKFKFDSKFLSNHSGISFDVDGILNESGCNISEASGEF